LRKIERNLPAEGTPANARQQMNARKQQAAFEAGMPFGEVVHLL